jgi:uncharacterized protein YPO0396/uncharacterized small protein (DUF1192 family)
MIALRKVRLVGWHYFDDAVIPIGEATLLAGDNGSGKSTVIDAIQYALAANLSRIRFNAAAADKRAGRTLEGYVRGKTGLESGEYLRDDAIAHVMLEFSVGEAKLTAGIAVEAFKDEVQVREYPWIAEGPGIEAVAVRDDIGRPLSGRAFRDALRASGALVYDSKRDYNAELTHRLGVFKRNAEFNPYLDAVLRSVSFSPLASVDKFVCDYILDERPVDVSAMKANLESYKEAEREADAAVRKIELLTGIARAAGEWSQLERLLVLQGYLKLRADAELAAENAGRLERRKLDLEREIARAAAAVDRIAAEKVRLEASRRDAETALARDDAYLLVRGLRERRDALQSDLLRWRAKAERWELLRGQCAALLGRPLGQGSKAEADIAIDADAELAAVDAERSEAAARRVRLEAEGAGRTAELADVAAELADLERGLPRYPAAATRLKAELAARGVDAWIFADLVEVEEPEWRDAAEGWLNTLRFAVLVEPGRFKEALGVYDALPRDVAGVALPNLEKMRGASVRSGSLAPTLATDSPYARIYADFVLGDVMRASLDTLKDFEKAVTKDCMSYSRHTATRLKEEVYARWYLGRAAREQRLAELRTAADRLRSESRESAAAALKETEREDALRRAYGGLHEMKGLAEALWQAAALLAELAKLDMDIAAVDLSGARELEARIAGLAEAIARAGAEAARETEGRGHAAGALEGCRRELETAEAALETGRSALAAYVEGREQLRGEFETYYAERAAGARPADLAANYEGSAKGTRTRLEGVAQAYRRQVQEYNGRFNALLSLEPALADEAAAALRRYEDSELPRYREKIAKARADAERQFKEHFVARLNEYIEDARESFAEINETLKALAFGRDQYRFTLEERADRRGQLDVIRKAAEISDLEGSLFAVLATEAERRAVEALFERILRNDLDSFEVRAVCDYRTYFSYDIKLRDLTALDSRTGKPPEFSLSKVIREKSGGEAQTPYYVAIAASFYRFYKDDAEHTVRLVLFDEAFNRMDDERIGKALEFFRRLGMQVVTAVPTEKLETVAPYMDAISLVVRHGYHALIRDFRASPPAPYPRPEPAGRPRRRAATGAAPAGADGGIADPTVGAFADGE